MSKNNPNVSISLLIQMLNYAAHKDIDTPGLLSSLGISPDVLTLPDGRISSEEYSRVQNELIRITGNPDFGLHMGEYAIPGSWSVLGYILMNCPTIGDSLAKYGNYSNIVGTYLKAHVTKTPKIIKISFVETSLESFANRHCSDAALSALARMIRNLAGSQINPVQAAFAYEKPASIKEYNRIFASPLVFSSGENALMYDSKIASIPVVLASPSLLNHLEKYADEYIIRMDTGSFAAQVSRVIMESIGKAPLSVETAAKNLSISARTLQHRLKSEKTDFSTLLQDIRERLAKKYLLEHHSVDDISYLLSFAEQSIFRRAFKKWTGKTPGEFVKSSVKQKIF
jgi:AraC-like DNA-binding protein